MQLLTTSGFAQCGRFNERPAGLSYLCRAPRSRYHCRNATNRGRAPQTRDRAAVASRYSVARSRRVFSFQVLTHRQRASQSRLGNVLTCQFNFKVMPLIFNPVRLIEEVKARPGLYAAERWERTERLDLWKEVGAAIFPDWAECNKSTVYGRGNHSLQTYIVPT